MRNAQVHGSRIYGTSDDLIEFEGNVEGEVGFYSGADDDREALVTCSDGTVFLMGYGKGKLAIWRITLLTSGALFCGIQECHDEDADPYSDIINFQPGLKWAYVAKQWERVK